MVWWLRLLIGLGITAGGGYWYNKNVLSVINSNIEDSEAYEPDYDYEDNYYEDEEDKNEDEPVFEF